MEIKQYKVEKGIATPVNHLETATEGDFYRRKSEGVNWGDFLHEQWHKFEDEKAAHTYATNAQDGVYDADCFKLKWQCYDHDREQWQDAEQSAECTWEKFNEWFRTTRKYLQFIDNPIPKMETTELPSPEAYNDLKRQLNTQAKHKDSIRDYWLSCSESKKKWVEAIKEYFDSEHTEAIQSFDDFKEQFDLD